MNNKNGEIMLIGMEYDMTLLNYALNVIYLQSLALLDLTYAKNLCAYKILNIYQLNGIYKFITDTTHLLSPI